GLGWSGGRGGGALRPRGWAGRLWSPAIGAEHVACREAAALFDETSFAKLEVAGPGAAEYLERLCDNRVARDVGAITYTQMLNRRGGVECDFTVTRLAEERCRIGAGTAVGQHSRDASRPRARERPPVHARARARGRAGAVRGAPGHLRRRARLGALLPDGVRPAALGRALAGRSRLRSRRRRLPRDRLAPAREGLPRLGLGRDPRRHALRGRPRLRRQARQGRLPRPRGAPRGCRAGPT